MELPKYLSPSRAGEVIGVKPRTLAAWRGQGCGPPFARLNERGDVRYDLRDLEAFMQERKAVR